MNDIAMLWRDFKGRNPSNNVVALGLQRQAFIAGAEAMRDLMMTDFEIDEEQARSELEDAGQQSLKLVPSKDDE